MKNRNGRSTTSVGGTDVVPTTMPVAAAAVVPFSSTAMIALWMTRLDVQIAPAVDA